MKDIFWKIKDFFTNSWIGIIIYSSVILLWSFGVFEGTIVGDILNIILILSGICIFGFLAFCIVVTVYTLIKNSIKAKIRSEIRTVLNEEKRMNNELHGIDRKK